MIIKRVGEHIASFLEGISEMQLSEIKNQGIINHGITGGKISFLAGCVVEDNLYFSSWCSNGFYKMDLKTGVCSFLGIFENELKSRALHNQAIFFSNTIWFIPTHGGNKIVKVNIKTLEKKYIDLPENGKAIKGKDESFSWEFKCCYKDGDSKFWLAPLGYNMLLCVNMLTDQILTYDDFENRLSFKDGRTAFSDACLIGDDIWLCPFDNAEIVTFNIVTQKFQFFHGKRFEKDFRFIRNYKDWVIILSRNINKSILLINRNTYEEKEILLDVNWEENKQPMYMVADMIDRFLILAPYWAHEFIVVDIETGSVQTNVNLYHQIGQLGWEAGRYQSSFVYDSNIIYTSDIAEAPLMVYDISQNKVSYMEMLIDWEDYKKTLSDLYDNNKEDIIRWIKQKGEIILEREFPFLLYIFLIETMENKNYLDYENFRETIGERVYLRSM